MPDELVPDARDRTPWSVRSSRAAAAGLLAGLLALLVGASAAGPGSFWSASSGPAGVDADPPVTSSVEVAAERPESRSPDGWAGGDVVATIVIALLVVTLVVAAPGVRRDRSSLRRDRSPRARRHHVVPGVDTPTRSPGGGDPLGSRQLPAHDARNEIVACWAHVERAGGAHGVTRRDSETSAEYGARAIELLGLPPDDVRELAHLYREARFSSHPIEPTHSRRAAHLTSHLLDALDRPVTPS